MREQCTEAEQFEVSERERKRKTEERTENKKKLDQLIDKHARDFDVVWGGLKYPMPIT